MNPGAVSARKPGPQEQGREWICRGPSCCSYSASLAVDHDQFTLAFPDDFASPTAEHLFESEPGCPEILAQLCFRAEGENQRSGLFLVAATEPVFSQKCQPVAWDSAINPRFDDCAIGECVGIPCVGRSPPLPDPGRRIAGVEG